MPKPQVSAYSIAADQPTDREADSKCLSPLRRKTSELEGDPTKGSIKAKDCQDLAGFNDVFRCRLHLYKHIYARKHCFEKPISNIILHSLSRVKYTISLLSRLETLFYTIYFEF
jgi:hypothetical protein